LGGLRKVLAQVAHTPDVRIRDLRMLQPWEREMLLSDFNDTDVAVPGGTMLDLAERARPSVEDATGAYTYAELDRRASIVAEDLIARGVVPDDVVALQLERSKELLVAILGVWKTGAGYLPIEPDAPA